MQKWLFNPRSLLFVCRVIPLSFFGSLLLLWMLKGRIDETSWLGLTVQAIMFLFLALYILLVFGVLPQLIYEGRFKGHHNNCGYQLFAGITAGIGPLILYFIKVEPALRKMKQKNLD
jgi:hypothetical protein